MINLIMPMAGEGSRFLKEGILKPKPLIKIYGKPFFYWATNSIIKYIKVKTLIFVVLQKHINDYKIDEIIKSYYPQAQIVVLEKVLQGAVLTSLAAAEQITNNYPVVFNDCDHMFQAQEFYNYCNNYQNLDGCLLTFKSSDPKFSFVLTDFEGYVTQTVEKQVISNHAICGAYYFKNTNLFQQVVQEYLKECSYQEYFMSGLYNVMYRIGYKSKLFKVDWHLSFGTPQEYKQAFSSSYFQVIK